MPERKVFRRGDVVLVLFPNSNLRTARLRPVLIIQADNLGTGFLGYEGYSGIGGHRGLHN